MCTVATGLADGCEGSGFTRVGGIGAAAGAVGGIAAAGGVGAAADVPGGVAEAGVVAGAGAAAGGATPASLLHARMDNTTTK